MTPFYLDYHATTPMLPEVVSAMEPFYREHFGNPASQHAWGWKANMAVGKARGQLAKLFNGTPENFLFTSGATESIHLAILGWLLAQDTPTECRVLTSNIEHKATLGAAKIAAKMGAEVVLMPVNRQGQIEASQLEALLSSSKKTIVSIIHGHNEIGSLNDISALAATAKKHGAIFHVDAAQSTGKIPVDLKTIPMDLLSLSGHKMYGPKGVGALFVRDTNLIHSLFTGGGQEFNLRAGTLNVPGIVGLGRACEWALENGEAEASRLASLRDLFFELVSGAANIIINGHPRQRLPHNVNITVRGVSADRLNDALEGVGFSAGSACGGVRREPNHVHAALGISPEDSLSTVRFGFGLDTGEKQIRFLAGKILDLSKGPLR